MATVEPWDGGLPTMAGGGCTGSKGTSSLRTWLKDLAPKDLAPKELAPKELAPKDLARALQDFETMRCGGDGGAHPRCAGPDH